MKNEIFILFNSFYFGPELMFFRKGGGGRRGIAATGWEIGNTERG